MFCFPSTTPPSLDHVREGMGWADTLHSNSMSLSESGPMMMVFPSTGGCDVNSGIPRSAWVAVIYMVTLGSGVKMKSLLVMRAC